MLKPGAPQIQIKSFTKVIYSAFMALFSTKRYTSDSDVRFSGVYVEKKEKQGREKEREIKRIRKKESGKKKKESKKRNKIPIADLTLLI
jgi:hypothetical protein